MISLFLSTATKKIVFSLVKDNAILYKYVDDNDNYLSERIMPIIDYGFKKSNLSFKDIDLIFIVNGPGSFTGTRIGVTIAKVAAWSLSKKIVTISSLEMLASLNDEYKYIAPMIDARRNYVYAGLYDNDLKAIVNDQHILLNDFLNIIDKYNVKFVSEDNFEFKTIDSDYNILKVINKHINQEGENPHSVNPNYLKLTEAEEKFLKKNDN